jgi:hypothetical protein
MISVVSFNSKILWFGKSHHPIHWCHMEATARAPVHPRFGDGHRKKKAGGVECELWGGGSDLPSSPASSTFQGAPSECLLNE